MTPDTPLPQEEPGGQNPPEGAIIDYYLKDKASSEVKLEILNSDDLYTRIFSSNDQPYKIPEVNIPNYWIRPQQILSGDPGHHRFLWDLHYEPLKIPVFFPMNAIYKDTAPEPTGPWVIPGEYTIRLTVNGQVHTQKLTIKMDPRVNMSNEQLKEQHMWSLDAYRKRIILLEALDVYTNLNQQLLELKNNKKSKSLVPSIDHAHEQLKKIAGGVQKGTLNYFNNAYSRIFTILQDADMPVTTQTLAALKEIGPEYNKTIADWSSALKGLLNLNNQLKKSGLPQLKY
jgi:hypothetical protein